MFSNYFKIAWRVIRKNKLYSFVNIAGLTMGIAACLLIGIYVWNELTFDRFHKNADRIARASTDFNYSGTSHHTAMTGTKAGPEFKRLFPQVSAYARTMKYALSFSNGPIAFDEKQVLYADADFFKIFSFSLKKGNPETALDAPQKMVMTEKAARKYFGQDDPIGKVLRINGGTKDYLVTGIVEEAPLNSQIQYDILISFSSLNAFKREKWSEANYITYFLMSDANQLPALQSQINAHMDKIKQSELRVQPGSNDYMAIHLQALKDVHLHSNLPDAFEPNGNITYIYVLIVVALLILLIACVNYTNLATAQSVSRGTEIGVRKVMGAGKFQLLRQLLSESFVISFVALVLAMVVSIALLPVFNKITGKEFPSSVFFQPIILIASVIFCAMIAVLAGLYPALVLSNTRLVNILKSGLRITSSGGSVRKSLITLQFVIAIFLVAATLIVVQQVYYIQHKNLGYSREQVVVLPIDNKSKAVYESLKESMKQLPGVTNITGSYEDPTSIGWGDGISADDGNGKKELSLTATPVDLDYLKTMGMELAAGRDFVKSDFIYDSTKPGSSYAAAYIINEKAAKDLSWTPQEAVGKIVSRGEAGPIVGVVKDFHFESLHNPIGPLLIFLDTSMVRQMFVKVQGANIAGTLAGLESVWKSRIAHRPFDYHFMDEDFNSLYQAEARMIQLFSLFSGLAILLACLGLFALVAFTTIQRSKEIGIRKILGANVQSITMLLARQFLVLVLIAIVIAIPLAWWAGNTWLQDFSYRINVSWWVMALASVLAVLIAMITVSFHTIRAALSNPVKSLRTE